MRRPFATAVLVTLALAGAAACGDDDDAAETGAPPTTEAEEASTSTTAEGAEPSTDAGDAPERIVSLSPTSTEVLFAIGAGDQVVAVDDQSDYPEGVPTTDLSGFEPNLEAILSYEPDLVITSGVADDIVTGIESAGGEVLTLPAATTLDEAYEQIADTGIATGHVDEAADLVASMRADIDEILADVPDYDAAPTYYHELDDLLYSITSTTFIGELYGLAGLRSVADDADPDGEFGGYPQLSAEYLVAADPDFIFLADTECCGQDADTIAARPGFSSLSAVTNGNVVLLSDDVASRWGPRVVDLLRAIVEATAPVPANG